MDAEARPALPRRLLDGWLAIAAHFGEVQTLVLLGMIYSFVIGPAAVVIAATRRDFLAKRGLGEAASAWVQADSRPSELETVKHPY